MAFTALLVLAALFILRGFRKIRHAVQFDVVISPEGARIARAMGILNSVAHPIWMLGMVMLLIHGQGQWAMPLLVFVIGVQFPVGDKQCDGFGDFAFHRQGVMVPRFFGEALR